MRLLKDERAENPLEVGFYVLIVLLTLAFLLMAEGTLLDSFESEMNSIVLSNPLSSWGTGVMATYLNYINYLYYFSSIFIVIVLIWGIRAVIRRHAYTTAQNQTYNNTDDF